MPLISKAEDILTAYSFSFSNYNSVYFCRTSSCCKEERDGVLQEAQIDQWIVVELSKYVQYIFIEFTGLASVIAISVIISEVICISVLSNNHCFAVGFLVTSKDEVKMIPTNNNKSLFDYNRDSILYYSRVAIFLLFYLRLAGQLEPGQLITQGNEN